jgi:hypothetical protein
MHGHLFPRFLFAPRRFVQGYFHHYHDFIKQRDQNTIKMNKQQFLHEIKQPHTKSQKREADIMREIKQFINYTRKTENIGNIDPKDASIINAYFGV